MSNILYTQIAARKIAAELTQRTNEVERLSLYIVGLRNENERLKRDIEAMRKASISPTEMQIEERIQEAVSKFPKFRFGL